MITKIIAPIIKTPISKVQNVFVSLDNIKNSKNKEKYLKQSQKKVEGLKDELEQIKRLVEIENTQLNFTEDNDLIESHIYSINALEKQYSYYLKQIRESAKNSENL